MSASESRVEVRAGVVAVVCDYDDEVHVYAEETDGTMIEDVDDGAIDGDELELALEEIGVQTEGIEVQGDGSILVGNVDGTEVREALRDMGYQRVRYKAMHTLFHDAEDEDNEDSADEVVRDEDEL